jgi:predicted alpha/beta-hydrolase family hydrolase
VNGEDIRLRTSRGAALEASYHAPDRANGAAVVLAPGRAFGRALPLVARAAAALCAAGFHALRFDWAYTTRGGEPSPDFTAEREDLDAAIAYARALPGVRAIVIGGKSLGAAVALGRAADDPRGLAGLVILTFSMHEEDAPSRPRPWARRLVEVEVPTLVVQGDRDPLGSLPALYALAARSPRPPRIVVVPGGHGFEVEGDPASTVGVDAAVAAVVLWTKHFAGGER